MTAEGSENRSGARPEVVGPDEGGFGMRKAFAALAASILTVVLAAGAMAMVRDNTMGMGAVTKTLRPTFHGYYDGHKDTYLSTDVSSKAQAKMMHVNFSAQIGKVKGLPEIYLVEGRGAVGQLAVFGSEPGEPSYSPLWDETLLHWKTGTTPVLITSDTQIDKIEKTGKLSESDPHVVLNCPIVKVG
jgi:hypothetical protein